MLETLGIHDDGHLTGVSGVMFILLAGAFAVWLIKQKDFLARLIGLIILIALVMSIVGVNPAIVSQIIAKAGR